MKISKSSFGCLKDGSPVTAYTIQNRNGLILTVLDYGCTVQKLIVPDSNGNNTDVVLGYDNIENYENNDGYLGAVIGRFANRIGKGSFTLNGVTYKLFCNDGENHLHGGKKGFDKYIWDAKTGEDFISFSRISPDGEEGYPGNLHVNVKYTLTENNDVIIDYSACSDKDTIINLTNHSYFNLNGGGTVLDHILKVYADEITENDKGNLPTGKFISVTDTPFDFRKPKAIGKDIDSDYIQLKNAGGYDHNFVLSDTSEMKKAASLYSNATKIQLDVTTTQPGMQVYTSDCLPKAMGKNGKEFDKRDAVCLETQVFPNATSFSYFPSPVIKANEKYSGRTVFSFSIKK